MTGRIGIACHAGQFREQSCLRARRCIPGRAVCGAVASGNQDRPPAGRQGNSMSRSAPSASRYRKRSTCCEALTADARGKAARRRPGRALEPPAARDIFPDLRLGAMERTLLVLAAGVTAIAASALTFTVWDYAVTEESGRACPSVQGIAELCGMFDSDAFGAQDTSALLVGVLTASAAILAISFTINQVVVSGISQKYSSKLVEPHAKKHAVSFAAFVLMVSGSAALLLAHGSLYPWIAAHLVLALTAGFFAALLLFAREFMRMARIASPYNFIKDAQEQILAGVNGSKGAPARPGEHQSLIRVLGDMAAKSRASNDADVCAACIDALCNVGKAFLDRKGDSPGERGVGSGPGGEPWRSEHAICAAEELVRILHDAVDAENTPIARRAVEKLDTMTAFAMQDKANEKVILALYDTAWIKGSPYLQLAERLTYARGKFSRSHMIRHLAHLPHAAVENGGHMPFVEQFVTFHVFRAVTAIIDRDDFELFREVIRLFSSCRFFNHMGYARDLIRGKIPRDGEGMQDLAARRERIVFELYHDTKKDFGMILELKEEIEALLPKAGPSAGADQGQGQEVSGYMDRLYVYSLLWGTFFRVACYIIHKGDGYARYLYELWYHDDYGWQHHHGVRSPPCSKDVDWNSAYPAWRGRSDLAQINPLNTANRYEPRYYEYAVLHMLREDKIWSVPTEDEVVEWGSRGLDHALRYHYVSMSRMNADHFLKALDSLAETKLPAEMLPGQDVQARIESVRKKLEAFRDGTQHVFDKLVELAPLDGEKISEWESSSREAYSSNTQAEKVARIKYDAQLQGGDLADGRQNVPRQMLFRGDRQVPDGCNGLATALEELKKILKIAGNWSTQVQADPDKPREAIESCVKKMRDGGHNPRVAFVSPAHSKKMPEICSTRAISAGGPPIAIVDTRGYRPPEDTWILDPDCVEITYKANNGNDRLQLEVRDAEAGEVTLVSSVRLSVRVVDGGGIARISGDA